MSISTYALICALINILLLLGVYLLLFFLRKSGKSDIRESRIGLVIASFVVPLIVTVTFVVAAIVTQRYSNYVIPVGPRGGGVFIILITSVVTSVLSLIALLPTIKHRWTD
jgi:hypothetical protein